MASIRVGLAAEAQRWTAPRLPMPSGAGLFCERTWAVLAVNLKLSRREVEIVRGVFNGQKESSMAAELRVSPHTIHTERERLYRKLGIKDRLQLMLRIMGEFYALTLDGATLPPLCAFRTAGQCPLGL